MNHFDNNLINLTQSLVKFASITPKDEGVLDFIKNYLDNLGFRSEILKFTSLDSYDVKNLYATIGKNGKHFAFAGHTDVVPTGQESDWKYKPFNAEIEDGKLFGRGSEDMKSAIACFMNASQRFINDNGKDFGGRISFIITGDEERDAINGTKKIMEWTKKNDIIIDDCIVGEPTSNEIVGDKIKIGRRGSTNFYIIIDGVQGHTANAHKAENPIHHLIKILNNITSVPLDEGNEHFLPSSLQIPTIDVGNTASNIIPQRVKATINIRFNNLHSANSLNLMIKNKIEEVIKNNSKIKYTLKQEITGESFLTKPNSLTDLVSSVCESVNGKKPLFATDGGTSDARFIKDYCQVLEIGIINDTLHKVDENVSLDNLIKLENLYYRILNKYFNRI